MLKEGLYIMSKRVTKPAKGYKRVTKKTFGENIQWGCDSLSKVSYNPATDIADFPFQYFPGLTDAELDFGLVWSAFKSIAPLVDIGGLKVSLLDILSMPTSQNSQNKRGGLAKLYYDESGGRKYLCDLVRDQYRSSYASASSTARKFNVLTKASASQSKVNVLIANRKKILRALFKSFMNSLTYDVYLVDARDLLKIPYAYKKYTRWYENVLNFGYLDNNIAKTNSNFNFTVIRSGYLPLRFPLLQAAEASALRQSISKWSSAYKNPITLNSAQRSCHAGVGILGELPDLLIAGMYPALLKSNNKVMNVRANPNAAKIASGMALSANKGANVVRGKVYTLGLLNSLKDLLQRYPQEIGTGNLTYRVLNAQLSESNLAKVCQFLSSRGRTNPSVTVKGLSGKSDKCVKTKVKDLLSALVLIDFMCNTSLNNRFGDYVNTYLRAWLPNRLKAVTSSSQSSNQTIQGTSTPGQVVQSGANFNLPSTLTMLNVHNLLQSQGVIRGQTFSPQGDGGGEETIYGEDPPSDTYVEEEAIYGGDPPVDSPPAYGSELPDSGSELPDSFDEYEYGQEIDPTTYEDGDIVEVPEGSEVTGGGSQVTKGDADKKSNMPLIVGGILLIGGIGAYYYAKKKNM